MYKIDQIGYHRYRLPGESRADIPYPIQSKRLQTQEDIAQGYLRGHGGLLGRRVQQGPAWMDRSGHDPRLRTLLQTNWLLVYQTEKILPRIIS